MHSLVPPRAGCPASYLTLTVQSISSPRRAGLPYMLLYHLSMPASASHHTPLLCSAASISRKCILVSQQGVTVRRGVHIWCHLLSQSGVLLLCHNQVLQSGVRIWCHTFVLHAGRHSFLLQNMAGCKRHLVSQSSAIINARCHNQCQVLSCMTLCFYACTDR